MQQYIHLQTPINDLILRTSPYAEILYWGEHLSTFDPKDILSLGRCTPNSGLDIDVPTTLAAENGRGFFDSPSLEGSRSGKDWSPVFHTTHIEQQDNYVKITSEDPIAKLAFISEFELDKNGVLKTRNTLHNLAESEFNLNRLSVTIPLPEQANDVMSFYGRWIREFQTQRQSLKHGAFIQENRYGRTSHEYFPGIIIGEPNFSEQQGKLWGFHLAWSGNHRIRADVKIDGRRFVQLEALYFAGEISLSSNQSFSTPWVYSTYSSTGLNTMSQQFHTHIREHILDFPTQKVRPVHLNIWEGVYFDHDPQHILAMAEKAAEMGVERFIIDDGWFKGRNDDYAGLGDWYLDERKYPQGLTPIINRVKQLGMQFGIWVELEMINKDSDLYRNHPDWLLQLEGYDQPAERHQFTLDLQNPQVFNYLLERMNWLLSNHEIDYIKWDMNRRIVQPGHQGKPGLDGQTKALYRLHDEIRQRYPNVEIEACASGGGRVDYEILKRTHRFWASDNNDALERQTIQRNMSYFFPLEVIGAHIGGKHCHSTYRQLNIQFRGITALFGHMGVELDPVKEGETERAGFTKYISLYKQIRPLLHTGNIVRLDMPDPAIQISGVIAKDSSTAVFAIAQLKLPDYLLPGHIRIPNLIPEAKYRVSLLDLPDTIREQHAGHLMKSYPQWLTKLLNGETLEFTGEWLTKVGLTLFPQDPCTATLLYIEKQ
ncbi:alpha-galactosidase [Gallibacterium melopsittaci]|uniref:Alpha-galactosidase n=1 Tax=Gallibacterium melopsittaci TaxID=516063 RepID=A0ABV6HV31_9PAST